MNTSVFLSNYDKINLFEDISNYIEFLTDKIKNGIVNRYYSNIIWFLTNSLELLQEYDIDYKELNLLSEDKYQNILNTIKIIINKNYNGFTE